MKKVISLFVLILMLSAFTSAQTPQFYNFNTGGGANSFPLGIAAGKMVQWLVLPGEFTGATAGNITKFYFKVATGYPINSATYTSLYLRFGQTTITSLTSGAFYSGTMDTVYRRASVTLSAAADTWLMFTLDQPFVYNPTQSLVIEMGHCGGAGATGFPMSHTTLSGNRRVWSVGGCPFVAYAGAGTNVLNCGVDISTAPTYVYPTNVCNYGTIPLYPSGVWAHGTEVLGDTLYIVGGGSAGSGSTTSQRYAINSNTFSAGTTLPETKASAPLVRAGNSLYLIGGGASVSTNGTTCWKYTPGAGWVSIAPLPTGLSGHGAVCWGDSVIFVLGGPYSSPATNIYYYRIATNTWGTSTPCLAGRRTAAYGIVGNKLLIMAGYNAAFFKNVQIGTIGADASTITWAAGPDVPGVKTGSSRPGGIGVGERFYFVPGETTPAPFPVDSIFVYNATTNAWLPDAYTGRGAAGTGSNYWDAVSVWVAPNGIVKIFIAGGALGTAFPGSWSLQVPACTITGVTNNNNVPMTYALNQNYPNPFNPVTKISFDIPKSGLVTIKIYDIVGKEITTLVNETKNAGSYIIDFDGASLSSGTYFYRMESNGFVSTKKMMLIK